MASTKDHRSSWSATLEEKRSKEERRLHANLGKILRENLASLLESGAEADMCMPYEGDSLQFHSCLVRIRLPKLWEKLQNEHERGVICQTTEREKFLQILRYIYTEDDLDPIQLVVNEIITAGSSSSTRAMSDTAESTPTETTTLSQPSLAHVQSVSSQAVGELSHERTSNGFGGAEDQMADGKVQQSMENGAVIKQDDASNVSLKDSHQDGNMEGMSMEHDKTNEKPSMSGSVTTYCQLGKDLLQLFQTSVGSNVKVKVKDTCLLLHRCILCVRSSYFGAMLGGQWRESEALEINLEGITPSAMCQALVYMYGGIPSVHFEDSNLIELITIADMYGLDGLKEIISFSMKQACHFFHKPCNDCIPCVLSVLPTADMFGLHDIWEKGLHWCSRYVSRVWAAKQFATLPPEIQDKCLHSTLADITNESVIDIILECDRLGGSLTNVRRSEPVIAMAAQLMDACIDHLRNNLVEITKMDKFLSLGNHMALGLDFLDDVFCRAVVTMPTSKACATYVRVWELCKEAEDESCLWTQDFKQLIRHLEEKCEHFMRLYINQLINTSDWKNMLSSELQERIKEGAWYVCVGDGRRLRGPPRAACYHESLATSAGGKAHEETKTKEKQKTQASTTGKSTAFRSVSAATRTREEARRIVTTRPKRLSSLPHSKNADQKDGSRPQSCTFKAVKMAADVMMSSPEVQRVKPIVRKTSNSELEDDGSAKRKHSSHRSGQHDKCSLKSFPSSGATVNTSLATPSSDSGSGDVFSSPEPEYVLVPLTVVHSLEVEAIHFPPEVIILYLEWQFIMPEK